MAGALERPARRADETRPGGGAAAQAILGAGAHRGDHGVVVEVGDEHDRQCRTSQLQLGKRHARHVDVIACSMTVTGWTRR